jgi:hypothetical protein
MRYGFMGYRAGAQFVMLSVVTILLPSLLLSLLLLLLNRISNNYVLGKGIFYAFEYFKFEGYISRISDTSMLVTFMFTSAPSFSFFIFLWGASCCVFFIDVFFLLTTCLGPFGPSSGESQYIIFSHTSPENYRYLNGSVFLILQMVSVRIINNRYIPLMTYLQL